MILTLRLIPVNSSLQPVAVTVSVEKVDADDLVQAVQSLNLNIEISVKEDLVDQDNAEAFVSTDAVRFFRLDDPAARVNLIVDILMPLLRTGNVEKVSHFLRPGSLTELQLLLKVAKRVSSGETNQTCSGVC